MAVFFCLLTTYRALILDQPASYIHYSSAIIQALILSKIILIGEVLKLGEKWEGRPLIIPTIYKAIVFTFFVLIFAIIEHFVVGYLKGHSSQEIYQELIHRGFEGILARILIVFFVFLLFFAFMQIGAFLGGDKLLKLFFSKDKE